MAKEVQHRRGTTAQHSSFTGAVGEVTVDTDKNVTVVHDGSTAGGFPLAKETSLNNKNVIINGNFDIWQRGTSFIDPGNNDYAADRFKATSTGVGVFDILQSTSVPDGTSDFSFQIDVTTIDASIDASDLYTVRHFVEGYNMLRFGLGTADAKNMTLSFWVRSSKTGIHCVSFRNAAVDRSYVVEYTINSADTWEFQTITIAGETSGTWLTDSGRGLILDWALAAGSDRYGTSNVWNSSNTIATSNQVNVMDSTANNFHLSRVQLEVGSVATEFERRSFSQELAMAQRYYETGRIQMTAQFVTVGVAYQNLAPFRTEKRIAPTITSNFTGSTTTGNSALQITTSQFTANSAAIIGQATHANSWTADAEL